MYWSRAVGQTIVVLLGSPPGIDELLRTAQSGGRRISDYNELEKLKERTVYGVKGVIYGVADLKRKDFRRLKNRRQKRTQV